MPPEEPANDPAQKTPSPRRLANLIRGMLLGGALAAIGGFGWWALAGPERVPDLTSEALAEAIRRWDDAAVGDYRLELSLEGRQPGEIAIEVRDGEVTRFTRDGVSPSQRRTWDYWKVENQLATIEEDLDSARDPQRGFGAPAGSRVVQRAEFDARYGYPRRYQRFILGTPLDVVWEITRFELLPPRKEVP